MEKFYEKATLFLFAILIYAAALQAQNVDITYKEKWNNRYEATIYFSDKSGSEEVVPDAFLNYENIYFTVKPNSDSEKEFFKEKDAEDYFSGIRLIQNGKEIPRAQAIRNIPNAEGKIDKVLLSYPKREVELYEPFTFTNELDTTSSMKLDDVYFMYFNKYKPIYEQGMNYSDQLKYPETFNTLIQIAKDAQVQQEIKYYSFYNHATQTLIENAIRQHADSLNTLLTASEARFMQTFSESDLHRIDSLNSMVVSASKLFQPYFEMDYPKSAELKSRFDELISSANILQKRNHERFKNNKLFFLQNGNYHRYQFSLYIDLLARMVTKLDTLIVIKELDTLNMATLDKMPEAKKELKLTGWEDDFATIVRMLNKEIKKTGKIFNDSIMNNLQKQKISEKQPYQQIFLAFNKLSTNEMLFQNFLKNALISCTDEDLIGNMEMWLLSHNLTFENIPASTVSNINRGIRLIDRQQWNEASTVFNTITRQANTIAPPWFYLGLILYEQQQTFAADAKFDLALGIYPEYIAPRLFKFRILFDQGSYDKLLTNVDEAIAENDIWIFHYWKAKTLFALEDYQAAIAEIETQCIEKNAYSNDEYFLLGDAYAGVKNFQEAEKAYSKTQEINPLSMDDRFNQKMQSLYEQKQVE